MSSPKIEEKLANVNETTESVPNLSAATDNLPGVKNDAEVKLEPKVEEADKTLAQLKKIRFPTQKEKKAHFIATRQDWGDNSTRQKRVKGPDEADNGPRLPKHKVVLYLAFSGRNYKGMQINPGQCTIEGELFKALVAAGAISKDNSDDTKKVSWMRSARTDKGVSAAGMVVSLKMITEIDNLLEKINHHLPEDIICYGFERTSSSFHAKNNCCSRVYQYLLPTYVFATRPQPDLTNFDVAVDQVPETPNEEFEKLREYRIDTEKMEKLKEAANKFIGSHVFHNYTIKRSFKEPAARRNITQFQPSEPFLIENCEWIKFQINGQSFMLHQIRKMIAMLIMLVRTDTPLTVLEQSLTDVKINIPKAPGYGLLLHKPVFDFFNRKLDKLRTQKNGVDYKPVDLEHYHEQMENFLATNIYQSIYQTEVELKTFDNFVKCLDYFKDSYYPYLNPQGTLNQDAQRNPGNQAYPDSDDNDDAPLKDRDD